MKEKNHSFKQMVLIIKKPFIFLSEWRSLPLYELLSYVFMFAGISMLAHGTQSFTQNDYLTLFASIGALYTGFFATLIWNDITDAKIDEIVHPDRPIPSKKIEPGRLFPIALVFSLCTFLLSFSVNLLFFSGVLLLAFFVAVHNKYLKKMVSIPAFSEIITPIQWSMFPVLGYLSFKTLPLIPLAILVPFTYFMVSSHDIIDGIHDCKGDKKNGVQTYANSFGIEIASKISFLWFIISGLFGTILYYVTWLSAIYLILFILLWMITLYHIIKIFRKYKQVGKYSIHLSRRLYNYFLFTFNIIFLDILIQILI